MALQTPCQTPGARFHTRVQPTNILVDVELPFRLNLTNGDVVLLEANLHNAVELVLAPYFRHTDGPGWPD